MNTNDLRAASSAVYLATEKSVADDLAARLKWAADEIDRLELADAELAIAAAQVRQLTAALERPDLSARIARLERALAQIAANGGEAAAAVAREALA